MSFNTLPFVAGPLAGVLSILAALTPLPLVVRLLLLVGGSFAIGMTAAAVLTTWWVFGVTARTRWAWVEHAADRPRRWLNLTTGFDDSTPILRQRLSGEGRTLDVFDTTGGHEPALKRARRRFPPVGASVAPTALDDQVEPASADAVLLLMSAHEAHGHDRVALFRSAARALTPDGHLVVVEHLRDLANILAFGPGAWHFSTRGEWLAVAEAAGLGLTEESRLSPFVAGLVFKPRPTSGSPVDRRPAVVELAR